MKIKSVEITGLYNNPQKINLTINDDLNIITGKNGAGKTTILKLIWYVLSGNISLALSEINFRSISLKTDEYSCKVIKLNRNTCQVAWTNKSGKTETFNDSVYANDDDDDFQIMRSAEEIPNRRLSSTGTSVFFPTFRRIEGGFSTEKKSSYIRRASSLRPLTSSLEDALNNLSEQLTNKQHIFVASLSTLDIESLLIRKHSELSEEYNNIQRQVSSKAIEAIKIAQQKDIKDPTKKSLYANKILEDIQSQIEEMESTRREIMKPLDAIKESVLKLLKHHPGIKIGKNELLNFGDTANAINSNLLSAGEKQMLSFLAYNTFYKNSIFIIDEPELSLHVDWQRILFSTLLKQGASNQFIVATHSPFIYSKYPDKEIQLIEDRGYCKEQKDQNE